MNIKFLRSNFVLSICLTLISISFASCLSNEAENKNSFAENKTANVKNDVYYDTLKNLYSNYSFGIGFDGPDSWGYDNGVSSTTIWRTHQKDSGISFAISVSDFFTSIKISKDSLEKLSIIDAYNWDKEAFKKRTLSKSKLDVSTELLKVDYKETFIRNVPALRMDVIYSTKDLDEEIIYNSIHYGVLIKGKEVGFTLTLPSVFYYTNDDYFENLFRNIYIY